MVAKSGKSEECNEAFSYRVGCIAVVGENLQNRRISITGHFVRILAAELPLPDGFQIHVWVLTVRR